MVAQYYWTLRSILKKKPHLKKYLTRCRHCQILFFTHPRNAGRSDFGCPFGCRQAHRQKNSDQRSTEYYRTKEGKEKKKYLNASRSSPKQSQDSRCDETGNDDFDTETVRHIQLVACLVEGRFVTSAEVYAMLKKMLRQHSRGHLFQGRFKSLLVDADEYLKHLSRYIHLNPVRAKMVDSVSDYPWSSYPFLFRRFRFGCAGRNWKNDGRLV